MKRILAAFFFLGLNCIGQQSSPGSYGGTYDIGQIYVPTSLTVVSTQTSFMSAGEFYNSTGAAITLTLSDTSTNCGSAACAKTFSIAAGQLWYPSFPGTRYTGGIKWSASATGLIGWLQWRI